MNNELHLAEKRPLYFTASELALRWRRHPATIRRMFRSHPAVVNLGNPGYRQLLIPGDVVSTIERRQTAL